MTWLLLVALLACIGLISNPIHACLPSGSSKLVTIGKTTYVCLIVNDRYIMVAQPVADQYSRIIIRGSWNATRVQGANSGCINNKFWYPNGCPTAGEEFTLGGPPYTNYYFSSMGVNCNYKKRYVTLNGANNPALILPITTAIIEVNNGVVTSTYWDDGCYWCQKPASGSQPDGETEETCVFNAFNLTDNKLARGLNPNDENGRGSDCAFTANNQLCPINT